MARKRIEQGYNQLAFMDGLSEQQERASYMCEVVSVPEYKQSKKRWQCMVKLLPDLWAQERNELCFVLAQKQASLDANRLALLPGDVVKIGGMPTGNQTIALQGGKTMTIERLSLNTISVFSRAPRLQPQTILNGSRRLLA
jgi:hypothetical protein